MEEKELLKPVSNGHVMPEYTTNLLPNPEKNANFFLRNTFQFLSSYMWMGYRKTLTTSDMFEPLDRHQSKNATGRLKATWDKEQSTSYSAGKAPSLRRTIFRTYGYAIIQFGILLLIEELIHLAQPLFMAQLIAFFTINSSLTARDAYIAATGVVLTAFFTVTIHHPYFYGLQMIGMEIKCAVSGMIVEKGVRLSSSALHKTTVGHFVNILSTDVTKFDTGFIFIHYMWIGPILLLSYGAVIWNYMGVSTLAGFAVILVLIPIQAFFGRAMGKCRRTTAQRSDKRISVMSEILSGIKVIKMYAWEDAFSGVIDKLRAHEMKSVRNYGLIQSTILGIFWSTGKVIMLVVALSFIHLGNTLSAGNIFVATALFNACRLPITLFLPFSFHCLFDMLVAIDRIQKVLLLEEFNESEQERSPNTLSIAFTNSDSQKLLNGNGKKERDEEWADIRLEKTEKACIRMEHLYATWEMKEEEKSEEEEKKKTNYVVEDIDLKADRGDLVALIGPVGAGKSSLLATILRETRRIDGKLKVEGRIAYCSQDAWIFSGTLRENVLFGEPFDEDRYRHAIELSALATDLMQMARGDLTIVGDRGASLSGGQKARISLARALYRDADIYLLDDPLSAVDASVGRFIYEKCISQALKDKLVILVTHQVQFVDSADKLVVMKGGKIVVQGTPEEMFEKHPEEMSQIVQETKKSYRRRSSDSSTAVDSEKEGEEEEEVINKPEEKTVGREGAGGEEEESSEGSVPWSVYWSYIKAMGARRPYMVLPCILVVVVSQCTMAVVDWWMKRWTDAQEEASLRNETTNWTSEVKILEYWNFQVSSSQFEWYFFDMIMVLIALAIARCLWFRLLEVDASRYLHKRMFEAVVNTNLLFFDKNPIGRILNRFSKDVSTMDDQISMVFFEFVVGVLNLSSVVFVILFLNPWISVPAVALFVVFNCFRAVYLSTSRDVKRLEATSRSPLYSHISALMNGLVTIRAFNCENTVMAKYHEMQNINISSFHLSLSTSRWFAIWIDWLVTLFLAAVAYGAIIFKDSISSGDAALMLTYAVQLTGFLSWVTRQSADLQNGMVSIERIVNYSKLEPEEKRRIVRRVSKKGRKREEESDEERAGEKWPSSGHIQLRDVWLRYEEKESSEFVLKGITVDIAAGEKIGIVGRTGAGKSSLLRVLFRLTNPSRGHIIIDDVDTSTLPLQGLRKSIGIIPQEPVLFVGTIRKNLDPFDEYSDDELWKALESVELKAFVADMGSGLESPVQEGGANVSVGQRQLLCLARALLRRTTILVIDEATANVDNKTDALIQQTIRSSFARATVLTIAHRLHTIMDSNRVIVLDGGELKAMDSPHRLLEDTNGILTQLARETGRANEAVLRKMAKEAFENNLPEKPPLTQRIE